MNTNSLLASAAINIGLAFVTLSLVSLLKKQPSTASIYYTRPFSHHHQIPLQSPSTSLHRFLPSVGWVFRAFRATEAEILNAHGVDALVIIRLFKFGIKFFAVCSLVWLVVLLPVNYGAQEDAAENDEVNEKCGLLELHCKNAMNAYCPPGLQLVNFMASESNSTPLLSF